MDDIKIKCAKEQAEAISDYAQYFGNCSTATTDGIVDQFTCLQGVVDQHEQLYHDCDGGDEDACDQYMLSDLAQEMDECETQQEIPEHCEGF